MSSFNDDHPEWGCLASLIGFIGDSFKVLLTWRLEPDESITDFLLTKVSALAVILVALGGLAGVFLYLTLKFHH